jgi:hypothetical protein
MKSIKDLALSRQSAFRHVTVEVPEWDGVKIMLREPSAEAWLHWQDVIKPGDTDGELSVSERAHRNLRADVTLFIDVLFDEQGEPVFSKMILPMLKRCMALFMRGCCARLLT